MISRELFRDKLLLRQSVSIGPVLGLDTGTPIASLGLVANGRTIADLSRAAGPHGASLPDLVAELLRGTGVGIRELAGVAVGIGPGSFTGLRIALSYAKGLVAAIGCPIVGIPSLDAMALGALDSLADRSEAGASESLWQDFICPVLDARKGEVYAALYRIVSDRLQKLSDDLVVKLEWLVPRIPDKTVLVGDRRAADANSLIGAQGRRATTLADSDLPARGRSIAALGAAGFARGEAEQAVILEPLYVRPPEATLRAAGRREPDRSRNGGAMEQREVDLIQQLAARDEELKALYHEHLDLKRQLETFRGKLYLTAADEVEMKRIQKLKLASKDRIMMILHRHQNEAR